MGMADRALKRAWLRLIGATDSSAPSTSSLSIVNETSIDSTLGSIQDDDTWVALACIDAIQNRRDVADNLQVCKHLLQLGIKRCKVRKKPDLQRKTVLHTSSIRTRLCVQLRLLEIWQTLYSGNQDKESSNGRLESISTHNENLKNNQDDDDDFDAWADVADTTPSPLPAIDNFLALADFLKEDIPNLILHLAKMRDTQKITTIIVALPRSLLQIVYQRRLELATNLLLSFAFAKEELTALVHLRLLPGMSEQGETGLIVESLRALEASEEDFDRDELQVSPLGVEEGVNGLQSEISSIQLLKYYHDRIMALQADRSTTDAAVQLANMITSSQLGLLPNDAFIKMSEELQLLLPLTKTSKYHHWTLNQFRNEITACHDLSQRQRLAKMYMEDAQSVEEVGMMARNGALPYLEYIAKKDEPLANRSLGPSELLSDGFQQAVLALADDGNLKVVRLIFEIGSSCGVEVGQTFKERVVLSCMLASSRTDNNSLQDLCGLILSKAPPTSSEKEVMSEPVHFAFDGESKTPSEMFKSLLSMEGPILQYHVRRSQNDVVACQQLSRWHSKLSPALLASTRGRENAQRECITQIIRAFATGFKGVEPWQSLIQSLSAFAKADNSFDSLSPKEIVTVAVKSVLQGDDLRNYTSSLKEISKRYLSPEEEEELILQSSREHYDKAISGNIHQGDMKVAHEILSAYGPTLTPRLEKEKAFIEATSRLCSFRIQSRLRSDGVIAPIEIRLSQDRMKFIKKLLESKEDAYKSPDLISEMAMKLCNVASGIQETEGENQVPSKIVIESRALALLTEAALGQADYAQAQISCERLVTNINSLSKRLQQSLINKGVHDDQLQAQYQLVKESAYRTCFLLCNQHEWNDYASRLRWASFVLSYCPEEQISRYLKTWRQLEEQFQKDLIINPPPSNWDQMAAHLKSGQGASLAASLAAIGNLSALESLGPFGNLFANARLPSFPKSNVDKVNISEEGKTTKQSETVTSPASRAAKLFDSLGGSNPGSSTSDTPNMTYLDPAERAARAARRFFGGFAS